MKRPSRSVPPAPAIEPAPPPSAAHWLGIAAVTSAYLLAVTMSVRPISSYDIGYHLAYGEKFLQTGHIVQSNDFVYTKLPGDLAQNPRDMNPGSWIDRQGHYRFVNANWLSQIVMAIAWRIAGAGGLEWLQVLLVAGMFALIWLTLRQHHLPKEWIAIALLLASLVSYERFNLRPELFGYVLLLGQWCLLSRRRFGAYAAGGFVLLQLIAANAHSYYFLAVGLAGAMCADALLRFLWARARQQPPAPQLRKRLKWLAFAFIAGMAACLFNPWFWRGAIMPLQTVVYLQRYHITGRMGSEVAQHPWAMMGELYSPFVLSLSHTWATWALYVLLSVTVLAGVAALALRRWGWLMVLVGLTWASIGVRRNIAIAGVVVGPLSVLLIVELWRAYLRPVIRRRRIAVFAMKLRPAAGLVIAVLGLYLIFSVASQSFYFSERRFWRFGTGLSNFTIPLTSVSLIDEYRPVGRVFTDQESSSNLMFFTNPHVETPVLTNTWAEPPSTLDWALRIASGLLDWREPFQSYDVQTVVLHDLPNSQPLIRRLSRQKEWAIAAVGAKHVTFIRRDGPNAALASRLALSDANFPTRQYTDFIVSTDPMPEFALHNAAVLLADLHLRDAAIDLWRLCLQRRNDYPEVHLELGKQLAVRGGVRLAEMAAAYDSGQEKHGDELKAQALEDWRQAEQHLREAIRLQPDNAAARQNLTVLQGDEAEFGHGRIVAPQDE